MSEYTVEAVAHLALHMYYKNGLFYTDNFKELAEISFNQLFKINQDILEQLTSPLGLEKLCRTTELLEFMGKHRQEIIQHIEENKQLERLDKIT